mgnify:FL=1
MKIRLIMLAVFAGLFFAGCKTQYEALLGSNDVEAKYEMAWKLYNAGKFKKSAAMFESLSLLTSGTERDDTVRYYWALSNYKYSDFITADANFGSFIEMYPRSPFSSEARFLKLDCMFRSTYRWELDQKPTQMAIYSISEYMMDYPDSDRIPICREMLNDLRMRLDTKEFEAARLYYKMEDYVAARTSLKNILKDNSENYHREEVLYYIAMSAYKYASLSIPSKQRERYLEFIDEYYNFIEEIPESKFRKELDSLYTSVQKLLGKI